MVEGPERTRWPRVAAVLVLGVVLSVVLFLAFHRIEVGRVEKDFERDSHDRISAFKMSLVRSLGTLTALEALYSSTPRVSRAAFRRFTGEYLLEVPGVVFLGWAPRVTAAERPTFESSVRREQTDDEDLSALLAGYGIFEVRERARQPASGRPQYFPVLYSEPWPAGRHTLGLDLGSDPIQGEALARARDGQRMAVSQRITLQPGEQDAFGVVAFNPVDGTARASAGDGLHQRGFVVGMFDVGAILEQGMDALGPRGIDVAIHDLSAGDGERLLYFHSSRVRVEDSPPWTVDRVLDPVGLAAVETLDVGDREWLISCLPATGYAEARRTWAPIVALVAGLLLTGLLAGSFHVYLGGEAEVHRYAGELLRAKWQLEDEAQVAEKIRNELAASEERYRTTFGSAPIGTAAVDLQGGFLQVNPALCRMLQYEEQELLSMDISAVTHPEDQAEEGRQMRRLVLGEVREVRLTERLLRRDGSEIWAELNITLVRDKTGAPLYFVGQQQDITERRWAAERMRKLRETQERILDSLPLNVFLKDSGGRIQFLNAAGRELFGLGPEEVVGKTDFDLFPEDEARALREIDKKVLESGSSISREEEISVGGRTIHMLSGKTAIDVEGSEEPHILGFSIDLTPVKEAEEALSRSEYRFRQLVENMSSGVAVFEALDDGVDFVFKDYNRAAEKMDGVARGEILGKRLTEVFPGTGDSGILDLFRRVWRSGEPEHMEATFYRDARIEGWREHSAYRLPSGEVVAIYDDAGERKRLEAELLHAQKMEAVGLLAGGVAHDFNNLLQVVTGNTDLLLSEDPDDKDRQRLLREIHEQAERGTQLARRLLVFSRRESFSPESIDLRDVLRGAETLVRRLVRENIRLVFEQSDSELPISGDRNQLEQVLMNLVVNASDAMPDGGRLELRSGTEKDDEVFFSVADTGSGIADDMLDKVFDPYFTTKSAAQGTGLGLAVVHGIVSLHGGRVEVDNRPGDGVAFKVVLPRGEHVEAVSSPRKQEQPQPRVEGAEVLVVEDQELVRRTIETMLASLGYSVSAAANGSEARERIASRRFDLLVSDIVLPDTTGVELAHEFRGGQPDLAVLLVSGYAEESVRARGAEFLFLQKPFRLEDLARQVARSLTERPG